jgi:mono/diheme cytochrome c family protein
MRRLVRWLGRAAAVLAALAVFAAAVIYVMSERSLRRTYPVPSVAIAIPTDPDSIREGERLARVRNCTGCHGKDGHGAVMFDQPMIARIVAPNLTAAVHRYTGAQIATILRNGVRPDGHSVFVMPAETYAALNDADLGRIVAWLQTLPTSVGPNVETAIGPLGRIGLALGEFKTAAELIEQATPPPPAADPQAQLGRYIATSVCSECHGASLRGASNPDFTSPNLRIVMAYSPEAFTDLLRKGVALGGRELRVMSPTAREHLAYLTDAEIDSLYVYLHTLNP